mgnify:CR=1 FL=1
MQAVITGAWGYRGRTRRHTSVYKVNVNYDMELAEKYDVMGVPALRLFVQGEVKAERAGAAGKADIEAWIDENLK